MPSLGGITQTNFQGLDCHVDALGEVLVAGSRTPPFPSCPDSAYILFVFLPRYSHPHDYCSVRLSYTSNPVLVVTRMRRRSLCRDRLSPVFPL